MPAQGKEFPLTLVGYKTTAVDEYIRNLIDTNASLHRQIIELQGKVNEANAHLSNLTHEEEQVKKTLETAKRLADQLVQDAYTRVDDIMGGVKHSCDKILADFSEKIKDRQIELSSIQDRVLSFKKELFENYRHHIELIDQLLPNYESVEMDPNKETQRIVTNVKKEIAAEYDLRIDDILTEEEQKAILLETVNILAKDPDFATPAQEEKPKKKKTEKHVMDILNEYAEQADEESKSFGQQLQMDIDSLLNQRKGY